jgi:hypothetical protein
MTTMTIYNEYNDYNECNEEINIVLIVGIVLNVGLVNSQVEDQELGRPLGQVAQIGRGDHGGLSLGGTSDHSTLTHSSSVI